MHVTQGPKVISLQCQPSRNIIGRGCPLSIPLLHLSLPPTPHASCPCCSPCSLGTMAGQRLAGVGWDETAFLGSQLPHGIRFKPLYMLFKLYGIHPCGPDRDTSRLPHPLGRPLTLQSVVAFLWTDAFQSLCAYPSPLSSQVSISFDILPSSETWLKDHGSQTFPTFPQI